MQIYQNQKKSPIEATNLWLIPSIYIANIFYQILVNPLES